MNKLDDDFKNYAKQINAKIKESAKILKEANAIAKKAGIGKIDVDHLTDEELEEHYEKIYIINLSPIHNAIDGFAQWMGSSADC
jgi:hypothetical protein